MKKGEGCVWTCPKCSETAQSKPNFCPNCGISSDEVESLQNTGGELSRAGYTKKMAISDINEPMETLTEEEIRAFVGYGYEADYFLYKWRPALEGLSDEVGFSWVAFFLTVLWLPFRKMYRVTLILYAIIILETILEEILFVGILGKNETPNSIAGIGGLVLSVVCGACGNRWYLSHTKKVVSQLRSQGMQQESYLHMLSERGGTNLLASLGFFVLFFATAFLVFAIESILLSQAAPA